MADPLSICIASTGAVLWIAALTLVVRGFADRKFRRNGYVPKD
jgi:hypothetical protein